MKKLLYLCLIAGLLLPLKSQGASIKELQLKHRQVKRQLQEKKKLLGEILIQQGSILKELQKLNIKLERYKSRIRRLRIKTERLESFIRKTNREIATLRKTLRKQRKWLKMKLQAMQLTGRLSSYDRDTPLDPLVLLASAEDMSQAVRRWYYFQALAKYDYSVMSHYLENLKKLKKQKEEKERLLLRYNAEKKKLLKVEEDLRKQRKKKTQFLASLQKKRYLYKQMVSELKKTERKIYRMLREAERKKSALSGFRKMKRRLPWPVQGRVALPFGSYVDPKYKTRVFRNGIYIKTSEGSTVKAVYDGEVIYADWIEGYGRVVIVRHGEGYYTVYGGLSEIFVKKGDIINRQDALGRVGESGVLNEPALYFEVRFRGKPLNPIYWLRTKKG